MLKIALCQMMCSRKKTMEENKAENQAIAARLVAEAAKNGAQIVVLPEIWNCPYTNKCFGPYSEPEDGETVKLMSGWAKEHGIYLVGGSIPENRDGKIYNTCFVFDREGKVIAKNSKTHLFDINVPGKIKFMESEVLTPGDGATVFDTEYGRMGVAICFDVRFSAFMQKMADDGAQIIFLPASFNMTTGPAHWDISMRMRAIDNQIFFAACAPARCNESSYIGYGNSCVADPWGDFIAHADETEQILYADIDFNRIEEVREQLPIVRNRRPELY